MEELVDNKQRKVYDRATIAALLEIRELKRVVEQLDKEIMELLAKYPELLSTQ